MSDEPKEIKGSRVAARREALGWTQEQLAERAGISQGSLSRIEGNEKPPREGASPEDRKRRIKGRSAATQEKLARALSTTIEHLRGESDDAGPIPASAEGGTSALREAPTALEDALWSAAGELRASRAVYELAREMIRATRQRVPEDADVAGFARAFLAAVIALDREGGPFTASDALWRVAVGSSSRAQQASRDRESSANADANARAAEIGVAPGTGELALKKALERGRRG